MHGSQWIVAILFLLTPVACTHTTKTSETRVIAETLERSLHGSERELVEAADAMPEEKYSFCPRNGEFKDVRTFEEEVKHVATVNYGTWAGIRGEKPPIDLAAANASGAMRNKQEIVKFLRDSFAYAHQAIAASNDADWVAPIQGPFGNSTTTRLAMAIGVLVHAQDHYGQMVEYLRMNRVVPPESR